MEIDSTTDERLAEIAVSASTASEMVSETAPKLVPRKLPKHSLDLQMPMMVYFPEDNDKIIRAIREYEYGGPLPVETAKTSTSTERPVHIATDSDSKKEIPLPGVSIDPNYEQQTPMDFSMPSGTYLKYTPPSWFSTDIHFDNYRIEYSIDDDDLNWLETQKFSPTQLDEEAMEILIDVLEKESFRQLEFRQINAQIATIEPNDEPIDEDDLPCSACGSKDWDNDNCILFCDGCNLPIHQSCQDLNEIPVGEWYCDTCVFRMQSYGRPTIGPSSSHSPAKFSKSLSSSDSKKFINFALQIPCVMCGMVDGGPFKKTQVPGKFIHVVCALMTPEVWFEYGYANTSKALSARKNTLCSICGYPGAIKCSHRMCNVHYHAICGRENGQKLSFHVPDPDAEENEDAEFLAAIAATTDAHDSLTETPATADNDKVLTNNTNAITADNTSMEDGGAGDDSVSESRSAVVGVDESYTSRDEDPGSGVVSLDTSTVSLTSSGGDKLAKKKKKKKKPARRTKRKQQHQPFQSLCALHSGAIRAAKLEEARKASLAIPVEIGRFLDEEDCDEAPTFTKALDVLKRLHTSKHFVLEKPIFDRVAHYWKAKRLSKRLGHMPFIFQLHVLVTHFKEDFDAGRRLENRPRQVEMTLAQYTPQKKFEILKGLRDGVESLRTLLDLIKKREVKKKLAIIERLKIFDELVRQQKPQEAVRQIYTPTIANPSPTLFSFGLPQLTIRIPVNRLKRSYTTTLNPVSPPPSARKKQTSPSPHKSPKGTTNTIFRYFQPTSNMERDEPRLDGMPMKKKVTIEELPSESHDTHYIRASNAMDTDVLNSMQEGDSDYTTSRAPLASLNAAFLPPNDASAPKLETTLTVVTKPANEHRTELMGATVFPLTTQPLKQPGTEHLPQHDPISLPSSSSTPRVANAWEPATPAPFPVINIDDDENQPEPLKSSIEDNILFNADKSFFPLQLEN